MTTNSKSTYEEGTDLEQNRARIHRTRLNLVYSFVTVLPLVSAISSYYQIRGLQLLVFLLIGLTVLFCLAGGDFLAQDRTLLILIWSISLSLLFSSTLVSENLVGWDDHQEFYIFLQVARTGRWETISGISAPFYNSALSISVFPAMLSVVSQIGGIQIFKSVYPFLFSITPVVLYRAYRGFLMPRSAFLSTFLFMSYTTFYVEITQLGRQMIAEPMFVLLMYALVSERMIKGRGGKALVILLTIGLVTAHYSLSYLYLVFLGFSCIAPYVARRTTAVGTFAYVIFTVVLAFSWYALSAQGTALVQVSTFLSTVVIGVVRDFLDPASRPLLVLQAFGLSAVTPGPLHSAYRATNYVVILSLLLGFLVFAHKRNKSLTERKMLPMMTAGFALLASSVFLPFFAAGLMLSRIFHISLVFTSPCFVFGTTLLDDVLQKTCRYLRFSHSSKYLPSTSRRALPALILVSYFLFTSGWVWAVTMDRPVSPILDGSRMITYGRDMDLSIAYYQFYVVPQDLQGADWLKLRMRASDILCADDAPKYHVLLSYGERLTSATILLPKCDFRGSYVYFGVMNTRFEIGGGGVEEWRSGGTGNLADQYGTRGISGYVSGMSTRNRVYSNGGTTIYAPTWMGPS